MEEPVEEHLRLVEADVLTKKEWLGKEIKPISLDEVDRVVKDLYDKVLSLGELAYTTTRGAHKLLDEQSLDYAKLPPLGKDSAKHVLKSLKSGQEWLDLGCGSGTFIADVLKDINPKIQAVGFDTRTWESQENIPELILGNIDKVDKSMFLKHSRGFDMVTSASVFYHLPDYWGALGRSIDLLKPNGRLLISTINRPMSGGKPINDPNGEFIKDPNDCKAVYHKNRNIFDVDGKLISMAEAVKIINSQNPGFRLEYHSGDNKDATNGELSFGGGFSGKKMGEKPMDLSFVLYCYYPEDKNDASIGTTDISFIFARTREEKEKLIGEGFVSVGDRIK